MPYKQKHNNFAFWPIRNPDGFRLSIMSSFSTLSNRTVARRGGKGGGGGGGGGGEEGRGGGGGGKELSKHNAYMYIHVYIYMYYTSYNYSVI